MGLLPRRRKQKGTLWHQGFAQLVTERAPPHVRVIAELLLSLHPRRADLLLLQRDGVERRDHEARILRRLWPRLDKATLVEFMSPSRGFREGDLLGLVSYGSQYLQNNRGELASPGELTLVLVVPDLTPTLQVELDYMQWRLVPLEDGYACIEGVMYTTYVVFTNQVSEAEADDYLRIFSQLRVQNQAAVSWFWHWMTERTSMADVQNTEDYEQMMSKLLEGLPAQKRVRIAGLTPEEALGAFAPEQRLAGLAPEQRLAGLAPEQQILALSDEVLRGLSEDYVRTLSGPVQDAIHRRLAKGAGRAKKTRKRPAR